MSLASNWWGNIWQELVFWQLHSPRCLKQKQSQLSFKTSLLNCCRKYKQNSRKCQNPVKKNFWDLPCAIHFLKKKLDRKTNFINTPSLNFLFLKAALYANQKQFLSNCSKQCLLNIFAPQLFRFGSSLFFSPVFKFNLSFFFQKCASSVSIVSRSPQLSGLPATTLRSAHT